MNAFPAAVTITGCVFTIMLVCQDVYHSNVMLNTACVLVTGWNYMSALRTVYSPLNTYRKVIIYGMQFAFFISAVVLQDLLTLGSLEFGMIILVFVLMTFSPILIETITEWILVCIMRSALCRLMVYFFLHSQKHPNAGIITPLASISCPEIRSVYMPSSSLIHATLS